MKSNLYFFFFLLLNTHKIKSQTDGGNQRYIPNITVTTPQAGAINKAGEIPIDISTGRINYSIPIFEIKEGNFTMPINLSYNYSGLLLDETPGYAGVGWTFNIGGAITHSINGLNDENHEYNKTYVYNYINKLAPYNDSATGEGQTTIAHFLENVSNGIFDGEPDKYSVNIGNLNCSFYLDKDNNPIFLKNENYKLTGNSTIGFTLTDDQGINYVFNLPQTADKVTESDQYSYNSSFLITEINFPFSTNKITFEYGTSMQYNDINSSQSLIKTTNQLGNPDNDFTLRNNTVTTIVGIRKLNRIVTNNYTIELQYNNNVNEPAVAVISNLKIQDKLSSVVKNYDFEFSPWAGRRVNLLNVKYNGAVTNTMEYDMSVPYPLPSLSSYYLKKDLWGYFNANAVPVSPTGLTDPYANSSIKTDLSSTKIGALTKITYQTKGYSLIDYEPNTVYMKSTDYNFPYDADAVSISTIDAATTPDVNMNDVDSFTVTTVPLEVNVISTLTNHTSINPYEERNTEVILYKDGQSAAPLYKASQNWLPEGVWIPSKLIFTATKKIVITEAGTYRIKAASTKGSSASITLTLKQRPEYFNQTVGGVRIKQIKNCDFNGECITTAYTYSQAGNSTGIMLQRPSFYSGYFIQDNLNCPQGIYIRQDFYNYTSIYPLSNFRGSPVLYKTVEKSDSNGSSNNGKIIYSYYGKASSNSLQDEENYFMTGLLDTQTVKSQSGTILSNQKNIYLEGLSRTVPKFVYTLDCKNIMEFRASPYAACPMSYPRALSDFKVGTFKHEAKNYQLQSVENKDYYYGQELVQTTSNTYDYNTGSLKSQINTNSKNETLETRYFYAQDAEAGNLPFAPEIVTANMLAIPLRTQTFNGTAKLSEQVSVYEKSTSTSNLLLPKYIYAGKFPNSFSLISNVGNVEKKVTYDLYDSKGNVLQYTLENNIPVSIIWGYNQTQPIAKIENLSYLLIPAATVTSLQTLSNADNDNCMGTGCTEQLLRNALKTFRNSLPVDAFASTYTYNPLIGVTSVTDPKEISSYYEYDNFGRLKFVKDKDLNVLQKYCYNYKGEQVDCNNNSTSVVLYKSTARSGLFTKINCAAGGTGSSITYNQAAGASTSTISQADADANGLTKFNADGQAYANTNPSVNCTFKNGVKSVVFTRNNCAPDGTPGTATYTVPAGRYSSNVSQADADAQAQADITANGQVFANNDINAKCTFKNGTKSSVFVRNNCAAGGTPGNATYTVPAGRYSSNVSQADADAQAQNDINANGQTFANNDINAKCTFKNGTKSSVFVRNNCATGGTPGNATYTVPAGRYSSDVSQAAADALAQSDIVANGQAFANDNNNAKCIFLNTAKSNVFTRNNCASGGSPQSAAYTVPAGRYSSNISQADADNQAQNEINANGQAFANDNNNAKCIFQNTAKSNIFTRNNCASGGSPQSAVYTVPAGRYNSNISQADADVQAQNEINANGQAFANDNNNAKCIFVNTAKSNIFTRNNCASGGSPQSAAYTVPAGRYSSNISQADADAQAQNEINANGQAFANDNNNAKCIFWNTALSNVITRNNCTFGSTSGSATYTVPAGRYSSDVSQAAADAQAQTEINNNGQTYANNNAICTFWNAAKSMTANKNNCAAGKYGSPGTYTVPAGTYSSTSSQLLADQRAQLDVDVNYQTYINSIGTCSSETYSVSMDDYDSNMSTIWITVTCNSSSHPARTVSPTIAYKYPVNQTSYITKQLVFAANKTSVTFQVSLTFVGAPTIQSYIIE